MVGQCQHRVGADIGPRGVVIVFDLILCRHMSMFSMMIQTPATARRETDVRTVPPLPPSGWLAGLGSVAGLGAIVASSCCAIPLILASLGATGAVFTGLEFMAAQRSIWLGAGTAAVAVGWVLFLRRRATGCSESADCAPRARSKRTALVLGIGTALIGLALVWEPYIEPTAAKLIMAARSGKIR